MAQKSVVVYAPGTEVRIGGGITGMVLAVTVRGTGASYDVAWWNGSTRCNAWLDACEISMADDSQARTIGFHGGARMEDYEPCS